MNDTIFLNKVGNIPNFYHNIFKTASLLDGLLGIVRILPLHRFYLSTRNKLVLDIYPLNYQQFDVFVLIFLHLSTTAYTLFLF